MNDYTDALHKLDLHTERIRRVAARPRLQLLMWEATKNCNLSCFHCCNQKTGWRKDAQLSTGQAKKIFSEIAGDFNPGEIRLGITGGEPTLRADLTEMVGFLSTLSFKNITLNSNGLKFLDDLSLLDKLVESGLNGLTISLDGMQEGYRKTRGVDRFHEIIGLLQYAVRKFAGRLSLHTLSLVNNYNKNEIPELMEVLSDIGIESGRVSLVSKVGRAETADEKLCKLNPGDLYRLLQWIVRKREDFQTGRFPMNISFVEDGWCGVRYELLTRQSHRLFFCTTGITIASILYDGKIAACPHVSPGLSVQGDALEERFRDVWDNRFRLFRNKSWLKLGKCKSCGQWSYCRGGPLHYRDENGVMTKCLFDEIGEVDAYEKTLKPSCSDIPEEEIFFTRIKIKDLPRGMKISNRERRRAMR